MSIRSAEHFWAASLRTQHCQSIVFLKMMKRLRYRQHGSTRSWYVGWGVTVSVYTLTHTHPKSCGFPGPGSGPGLSEQIGTRRTGQAILYYRLAQRGKAPSGGLFDTCCVGFNSFMCVFQEDRGTITLLFFFLLLD